MKIAISITILAILAMASLSFAAKEVSFTQDDRDRLIRLETKVDEGQKSLQRQLDDLKTFMLWGFGMLFGGIGLLIGFVIWDRRSALAPAIKKSKELEEREEKIEKALKEFSTKNPDLAEALKHVGL
jgi:uncharacterized membrane-anchored protein YhcB (DUF1043 family)